MSLRSAGRRPSHQYVLPSLAVVAMVFADPGTVRAAGSGTTQQDAGLSCKAIMNAGLSVGDGIYWIDPNGGSHADAFQAYCDMTTDGGGWTLAVNSVAGEEPLTNDMTSNTGVPGLDRGHTRNLANLAINDDAQIRYVLDDSPRSRMFHAKFTGRFHDRLPSHFEWTNLPGHTSNGDPLFDSHTFMRWSTSLSDHDNYAGSCSTSFGNLPWHYGACWVSIPTNPLDGLTQGPPTNGGSGGAIMARFSIFVRELGTLSPQPTDVVPSFGLTANLPTGSGPVDVAIADFDSDGKPDVVTANSSGSVTVRYGNGAVFHRDGLPPHPMLALAAGQFTSDNRVDFVTVNSTGGINLFTNHGGSDSNSSFTPTHSQACAATAVGAGDFDQDGTSDLALACGSSLRIAANNGGSFSLVGSFFTSVTAHSLAVADFDSDTRMDIVVTGSWDGCVYLFRALGAFGFASHRSCPGSYMGPVAVGEVTLDGKPDLLVGANTLVKTLRNLDGVSFTAAGQFEVDSVVDLAVADVDGNWIPDVIVAHDAPAISVATWAVGGFSLRGSGYGTSSRPRALAVGDLNGDGKPDIVSADNATDSVSIFSNSLVNAAPSAANGTLTVIEGTTGTGTLWATDREGGPLTFALASTGTKGTVTVSISGFYRYSANPGETGTDTFTFTASDGVSTSNVATITVTIAQKQTPQLTWAQPAPIVYGTALGGAQLNATAGIPGTMAYSPASGTILGAGATQTLTVTFTPADTSRYSSTSASVTIDVLPAALTVKASDRSIPFGLPILPPFTATFAGFVNGDTPASLAGVLSFTSPPSMNVGVYPITPGGVSSPNYAISFEPGTLTILPVSTVVMLGAGPATVGVLQPVTLAASIGSVPHVLGVPTGTVQFFDGATLLGTAAVGGGALVGGGATLTVNGLLPGVHAFTATYLGDANFLASRRSAAASVTVRPLAESTFTLAFAANNPTALGQRATFSAAVVSLGGAVPTGTVAFVANRVVIGTAPLSGGVATVSTTSLGVGPHFVVAIYLGNASFAPSKSTPAAHSVYTGTPPLITPMALSGPASPSTPGQPVTFTATVTSTHGTPPLAVAFLVHEALLDIAPITEVGGVLQASVTTSTLPRGAHVISAIYVGNGVFGASSAPPIVHWVR